MNYEKKYKEALERAKQFSETPYLEDSKGIVEYIFPELQESEDERIRKSLIDMLKNDEKCYLKEIAWLEKQGEHAKFRDSIQVGDKVTRNEDGVLVNLSQLNRVAKKQGEQKPYGQREKCSDCQFNYAGECKGSCAMKSRLIAWLKAIKDRVQPQQKQEWSKEDEKIYQSIMDDTVQENQLDSKQIDWLKSLKDRYTWKPSEKQIYSLDRALRFYGKGTAVYDSVKELLEQLKKLK